MKKLILSLLSILNVLFINAQTQYDYYDEDVAYEKPFFNGYTILGIIILLVIILVIILINKIFKEKINEKEKIKKEKHIKEEIEKKHVIESGGFICPICGKSVTDKKYATHFSIKIIETETISYDYKYCLACKAKEDEYNKKISLYNNKEKKDMPEWFGIFSLIMLLIANIYAIVMGIIEKEYFTMILVSMFRYSIISFLIMGIPAIIINISNNMQEKAPERPFKEPSYEHAKKCNAIRIIQSKSNSKK